MVPGEGSIFPDDGLPVSWVSSMACMEASVAGRASGQDHSLPCSPRSPASPSASAATAAAAAAAAAAALTDSAAYAAGCSCSNPTIGTASRPATGVTALAVPPLCLPGSCGDETRIDLILAHQNSSITRVLVCASRASGGGGKNGTGAASTTGVDQVPSGGGFLDNLHPSSPSMTGTAASPPRDDNPTTASSQVGFEPRSSAANLPSLQVAVHSAAPAMQEAGAFREVGSREAPHAGLQWSVVAVEKMTAGLPLGGDEQVMDCFVLRA